MRKIFLFSCRIFLSFIYKLTYFNKILHVQKSKENPLFINITTTSGLAYKNRLRTNRFICKNVSFPSGFTWKNWTNANISKNRFTNRCLNCFIEIIVKITKEILQGNRRKFFSFKLKYMSQENNLKNIGSFFLI